MKSHNPYMSDKEFQKLWNKMLKDIEKNADFIEEELLKIEKQERIRREDLEDAPYHKNETNKRTKESNL